MKIHRLALLFVSNVLWAQLQIVTTKLPDGVVGSYYTLHLHATGGSPPYTWTITAGFLPKELTLDRLTGRIEGTLTERGLFEFTVQVEDMNQAKASVVLQLRSFDKLQLQIDNLPDGILANPYGPVNLITKTTGGLPPYFYSIAFGSLPAGLILSESGEVCGTPTQVGNFYFTIKIIDSASPKQTLHKHLRINIVPLLQITTQALPNATVGQTYLAKIQATGGVEPYTFTLTKGTLPPYLTLYKDGVIYGICSEAGSFTFTVEVTDAGTPRQTFQRTFCIYIATATISISPETLPSGTLGVNYQAQLSAIGGLMPYTWQLTAGKLPVGIKLDEKTGLIFGQPREIGSFTFTVQVKDRGSPTTVATRSYTLHIKNMEILPEVLPEAIVNVWYSVAVEVIGGFGSYEYGPVGALAAGLELTSDGIICGTPTSSGSFTFTISVIDVQTNCITTKTYTISVKALQITTTETLPNARLLEAYSIVFEAIGGNPPYTWREVGTLPVGLSLSKDGKLEGKPQFSGTYSITLTACDSKGASITKTFILKVLPMQIMTKILPNAIVGSYYCVQLSVAGGEAPYRWEEIGNLPAGLSLDTHTGEIKGTPATSSLTTFTITVEDKRGNIAAAEFELEVVEPLKLTSERLNDAIIEVAWEISLRDYLSGGKPPYLFVLWEGVLPSGFSLTPAGTITGKATSTGVYNFKVVVVDASYPPQTSFATYTLHCVPLLEIFTTKLPYAIYGREYNAWLSALGGSQPYVWYYLYYYYDEVEEEWIEGWIEQIEIGGFKFTHDGNINNPKVERLPGTLTFTTKVKDSGSPPQYDIRTLHLYIVKLEFPAQFLGDGIVNLSYLSNMYVSGGIGPYTWSVIEGSLPKGLRLKLHEDSSICYITGVPTDSGEFSFTIRVQDTVGQITERKFTIRIYPVGIKFQDLPPGRINSKYGIQLEALGGYPKYRWSVVSGWLPEGLELTEAGMLQGIPKEYGTFTFTVKVEDAKGGNAIREFKIFIDYAYLKILTKKLTAALLNEYYTDRIEVEGGCSPYTFSMRGSPIGLNIDTQTGIIFGTPKEAGSFTIHITVRDVPPSNQEASRTFSLYVIPIQINTISLPEGIKNIFYRVQLSASGGLKPYTWSIKGDIVQTLSFSPDGILEGTPTQAGIYSLTITVKDQEKHQASKEYTLIIKPMDVVPLDLPAGRVGEQYRCNLEIRGGRPPYLWKTITPLPEGLTLLATFTSLSTNTIYGTPTQYGKFTFQLSISDSDSPPATIIPTFSIEIYPQRLEILTIFLPDAPYKSKYCATLTASGGHLPYTWQITSGRLPQGIFLSSDGVLYGTPTEIGAFSFTIKVKDSYRIVQEAFRTFNMKVKYFPIEIVTESLPFGTVGINYEATLEAQYGELPYNWWVTQIKGPAVAWQNITAADSRWAIIYGTPTRSGTYTIIVTVGDIYSTATREFDIWIAPMTLSANLPNGTVGITYIGTASVVGGTPPYKWEIGILPQNLTYTTQTMIPYQYIVGTPTQSGIFEVNIKIEDFYGEKAFAMATIAISIFTIKEDTLPEGRVGERYFARLTVDGGVEPLMWSVKGLPAGLKIVVDDKNTKVASIQGYPQQAASYIISVAVTDSQGNRISKTFTLIIYATELIFLTDEVLPSGLVATAYCAKIEVTGGKLPYTFSISQGQLPEGLEFKTYDKYAEIRGIPKKAEIATFTVAVSSAFAQTKTKTFKIEIVPGESSYAIPYNNLFIPCRGEKVTISYYIHEAGHLSIKVYDIRGVLVKTLVDTRVPKGAGMCYWFGRNEDNQIVGGGTYILHIKGPGINKLEKMFVVK